MQTPLKHKNQTCEILAPDYADVLRNFGGNQPVYIKKKKNSISILKPRKAKKKNPIVCLKPANEQYKNVKACCCFFQE
jgi:hypothetical protein